MPGKGSRLSASFNIAKVCLGAGLLGLPRAFQKSGVAFGVIGAAIVLGLNDVCCRLLVRSKAALPRSALQGNKLSSYSLLAYETLGQNGMIVVDVALIVTMLGAGAVYLLGIAGMMIQVFPSTTVTQWVVVSYLLTLPFGVLRDLSFLSFTSLFGLASYLAGIVVILAQGASENALTLGWEEIKLGSFGDDISFFGVVAFSVAMPVLCFPVQESMADPSKFLATNTVTLSLVLGLFCALGVFGVGLFTQEGDIPPIIINSLPPHSTAAYIVKTCVSITLWLSSPLATCPALSMLENYFFGAGPASASEKLKVLDGDSSIVNADYGSSSSSSSSSSGGAGTDRSGLRSRPGGYLSDEQDDDEEQGGVGESSSIATRERSCGGGAGLGWAKNAVRMAVLTCVAGVAMLVPCFTMVMSLIGCVSVSMLCFVLPPLFYLRLVGRGVLKADAALKAGCCAVIGFGLMCMVGGLVTTLEGQCE